MNGTTELNFAPNSKVQVPAGNHLFSILKVAFILLAAVALLITVSGS